MSLLIHTLHVDLGERSYPVYIGRDLFSDSHLLASHVSGSQVVLVSNETVAPIYLDRVRGALETTTLVSEVILPDGEQYKSLETLEKIFDQVMADRHDRGTTFIAVGGGVVGDITGFAAACYQRGVNFIQIPTTLLAQVDSSVGGKTAVNHPLGKNMIGAFYQPQAVLIDTDTLRTLPAREFAAGLAEVVKYGLISDEPFYRWLKGNMPKLLAREEAALAEAIERSCANKAKVVAADEREGGVRAILNLGHTFAHAIENAQGYGVWLHGEAVAAGMVLALRLSCSRGLIQTSEVEDFIRLLRSMNLPVEAPNDMTSEVFLDLMGRDKKVVNGKLRLVLISAIGQACIVDDATESELINLLS
ncbi:MAG: 3-dehydroquinate synthase [Halioglobus sp.]